MMANTSQVGPNIAQDLRGAMPGEMKSWAEYNAFADQADRSGHHELAQVWRAISHVERYDHFYHEAELHGYIQQDSAANLRTAVQLAEHRHQQFSQAAQQASSQGANEVADFFRQADTDAQRNKDRFNQALNALQGKGQIPQGPRVSATQIRQSQPACQGQALSDLKEALKTTAFAAGLYWLFARRAVSDEQPDLGALFLDAAQAEMDDHFARAANLSGLVGDDERNLHESVQGETKAHQQYTGDVQQAQQKSDQKAASFFKDAASDEEHHKHDFETFLQRLSGKH